MKLFFIISFKAGSLMYPYYEYIDNFVLPDHDKKAIQKLYGKIKIKKLKNYNKINQHLFLR